MHIHVGALFALLTFANVVIVGFIWRLLALYLHETPWGKAMAFVY